MQLVRSPRPGLVRRRPSAHSLPPVAASAAIASAPAGRAPVRCTVGGWDDDEDASPAARWRLAGGSSSWPKMAESPHGGSEE